MEEGVGSEAGKVDEIEGRKSEEESEYAKSDSSKVETSEVSSDNGELGNRMSESSLKGIKSQILEITKPVVEKKEAETMAVLRQEREKKKVEVAAFEPEKTNDNRSIQDGKRVTVPTEGQREHLYKVLVIGELGTGKTSIIKRYVHQFFSQHYRATIGVDFALKVLNWDQNTIIRLQLWDIAGQERFGNMTRVYYKEAVGAFIVFDVTRTATFDAVVKWKEDLDSKVQLSDGSPIPCILLANKCDQPKEGLVNNKSKMDEYCREKGFSTWYETSAKENINIEEASRSLVNKILQNDKLVGNGEQAKDMDKFVLDRKSEKGNGKSCWC